MPGQGGEMEGRTDWSGKRRQGGLTSHTTGPSATRGGACACWAVALLGGVFRLFFQTSGPAGWSQPDVLGAGLSGLGWVLSLLTRALGSTCSPKSSSMLVCRVSVRRRASRGLTLLQGQGPGPGLPMAAELLELHRGSSSSLPQSRPLSGLLVAERLTRQPLSSRRTSSVWGPAVGPLCFAGIQEPCKAPCPRQGLVGLGSRVLDEHPKPCLCRNSQCSVSSSATSGILNSLVLCGACKGHWGCSRKAPSQVLCLWHS